MELLLLLLAAAVAGSLVGCATGLVPSLHVNTLSLLLLAAAPTATVLLSAVAPPNHASILLAATILAITVSHTFVNVVPAAYLGAPEESTALSVLPAHRLLLRGQGYRAVRIGALASFFAFLASLLLLAPAKWALGAPLHLFRPVQQNLLPVLLGVAALLVWTETRQLGRPAWSARQQRGAGRLAALSIFLAAGLLGLAIFRLPYEAWVPLPPSPLLPALSGLFGAATLLEALTLPNRIPHQYLRIADDRLRPAASASSLAAGVAAGATISLLPGLTNASATGLATALRRGTDAETLVSLGAVNTANAVFNLLMLYLFLKTRSGAVVALEQLMPVRTWEGQLPSDLLLLLFSGLAAAAASLALTLALGRLFARRIHRVPYRPLLIAVLAYMTLVSLVFTGWTGLLVFATGAALGLVPVRLGLRRTHLTGVLLVPILSYLLAQS